MERVELTARPRTSLGSGAARRFRRQGQVPAVVYGHGEPASILVDGRSLDKALRTKAGTNVIITLKLEGAGDDTAIVRDIQRQSLTKAIEHADFLRISLTDKIVASVPIEISGTAPAIKEGGILMQAIREIEVRCLPLEIPAHIVVDVTKLANIHDLIHASELTMPQGVELVTSGDVAVVSIAPPEAEEVAAPAAGEAAAGAAAAAAEPEVIAKGKEEKGDEKAGEKKAGDKGGK
jgi:large subunit ribosomal protein L25